MGFLCWSIFQYHGSHMGSDRPQLSPVAPWPPVVPWGFRRHRFARAPSDALEISSTWREEGLERSRRHPEEGAKPKFAYNAHVVSLGRSGWIVILLVIKSEFLNCVSG